MGWLFIISLSLSRSDMRSQSINDMMSGRSPTSKFVMIGSLVGKYHVLIPSACDIMMS